MKMPRAAVFPSESIKQVNIVFPEVTLSRVCSYVLTSSRVYSRASAPVRYNSITLLRGTILNRTYGTHKNTYISVILSTTCGPINYDPP